MCNYLLGALALLVGNAAAGLAGRLTGGLAFAAAALLGAFAEVTGFKGLNSLHGRISISYKQNFLRTLPPLCETPPQDKKILSQTQSKVKRSFPCGNAAPVPKKDGRSLLLYFVLGVAFFPNAGAIY